MVQRARAWMRSVVVAALILGLLGAAAPSMADDKLCPTGCGVCRKGNCGGEKAKCDQAALDKARAEYKRWLRAYEHDSGKADVLWEAADRDADEINELFDEELGPPDLVKNIAKDATIHVVAENVAKVGGKHVANAVGEAAAAFSIAKFLTDLGILTVKMRALDKEMQRHAEEAVQASDAAYQALLKAHAARDQIDKLEKQCRQASGGSKSSPSSGGDDASKSSGQKEEEAARQILNSWKKVRGGYLDADGSFYDAELARQRALEIAEGQIDSMSAPGSRWTSASSTVIVVAYAPSTPSGARLSPRKLQQFVDAMGPGFDTLARAVKDCDQARAELKKIRQLRRS